MNQEDVFYPNGDFAFTLTGTEDELDEVVYLFQALFHYIEHRKDHGWTEDEQKKSMEYLTEEVNNLDGNCAKIILQQDKIFEIDSVNKYYKKVLRGEGDIRYSVDEYLYNEEYYDVEDKPITFWTNTISEREYVISRLSSYQKKMFFNLRALSEMDKEFIKNPLLTGDDIIRYLDTSESIVTLHQKSV